jgi:hypothetical protein
MPKPARTLELEITALTDIDASYRTVGLGAAGPAACTRPKHQPNRLRSPPRRGMWRAGSR